MPRLPRKAFGVGAKKFAKTFKKNKYVKKEKFSHFISIPLNEKNI
jgi:hypothetical protein